MIARMNPFAESGDKDGRLVGLMRGVNKQYPGLFKKMMPSAIEARRRNRKLNITPKPGQTHQQTGVVKVTEEMHEAVCTFARKLAKCIYYLHTSRSFPNDGCLLLNWFSNADLYRSGQYPQFETLKEIGGEIPPIQRSGKYLSDQFEFKLSLSPEGDVFVLQALFGKAFGLVVFGSTIPGKLETSIQRLREQSQHEGPFAVLQSTLL